MNRTRPRSERTSNLWVTLWTTGLATSPKGQCTTRIEVLVGPCFGLGRQLNTTSSVSGSHNSSNPASRRGTRLSMYVIWSSVASDGSSNSNSPQPSSYTSSTMHFKSCTPSRSRHNLWPTAARIYSQKSAVRRRNVRRAVVRLCRIRACVLQPACAAAATLLVYGQAALE
jgi:hypothetical protein